MIAILGQTEDDILYFTSRFTNGEQIDELPGGIKAHRGKFGVDEIVIAATGYGNLQSAVVTSMIIDRYDPYLLIDTGSVISLDKNLHQGDIFIADRYYLEGIRYNPLMNTAYGQIPGQPEFFIFGNELSAKAESAAFEVGGGVFAERGYLLSGNGVYLESKAINDLKQDHYAYIRNMIRAYDTSSGGIAMVCYQREISMLSIRVVALELDRKDQWIGYRRKSLESTPDVGRVITKLLLNSRADFSTSKEVFNGGTETNKGQR